MIVKIQRPLATTENPPLALVYDKRQSFYAHMPFTPEIEALFRHRELKIYCHARLQGDQLFIGRRVREPGW